MLGVVTHVRVRSHRAVFVGSPEGSGLDCIFITVVNLSINRDVEVTHAWFETPLGQVAATTIERPLPVRLKPQQIWETWVPISSLAPAPPENAESMARVRLSDGRIVKGKLDASVPDTGFVPGGTSHGSQGGR